jgi:hypothetical protein
MGGTCSMYGRAEKNIGVLIGNSEENIPLERPRYRWEYSIKMDLKGVQWESVDSIDLAEERDR